MKFDPTKPFGTVHGICESHPGAKYQQRNFVYDAHHKCLNPKEAEDKSKADTIKEATEKLLSKKAEELKVLTAKLVDAQKDFDGDNSAANKSKVTKLTNLYEKLVAEIETMGA